MSIKTEGAIMNKDDVIRMAQEAGYMPLPGFDFANSLQEVFIERFANLVAAAEREECAKVVEEWLHGEWHNQGVVAALMIRERGAP